MDRDEWLPREALAELGGCSLDTVRRVQRENSLATQTGANGTVLLRLGDLIDLGRVAASVLDPKVSGREVADAIALRREVEDLRIERATLSERLAACAKYEHLLQAQIATLTTVVDLLSGRDAGSVDR